MTQHALENIKVIELGGYIVGSLCGSFLADLGADVIKFEPLTGDGLRPQLGSFQGWNRGVRGVAVDLRIEEGKAILHQLAEKADVLVHNLRQEVPDKWGVDYATLSRINPGIIYCALPGYGQTGPYIEKPAFDPILQARSGIMASQGGPGKPPVYYRSAVSDLTGATLGAYGIALALYNRAKTGKGQYLYGSLLNASITVQSGQLISYPGKTEEPRMDYWGRDATYRLYRTQDDWIFLGCEDDSSWQALCKVLNREELTVASEFAFPAGRRTNAVHLAQILETIFLRNTSQHWLDLLETAVVPCAPVNFSRELFTHPHIIENNLMTEHESFSLGTLKQQGMLIKLSETPGNLQRGAPGLGQHTDEILTELGYPEEDIRKLRENRVIL